jgi:hypothetical protein
MDQQIDLAPAGLDTTISQTHHEQQHRIGAVTFGRKYGIDLWALASEFERRSPDQKMRASLRLLPIDATAD